MWGKTRSLREGEELDLQPRLLRDGEEGGREGEGKCKKEEDEDDDDSRPES